MATDCIGTPFLVDATLAITDGVTAADSMLVTLAGSVPTLSAPPASSMIWRKSRISYFRMLSHP
eukprot:2494704-Amphidinium_carterae.1